MRSLLWAWSVPAGVIGAGLGHAYLSRRAEFLDLLAPRTRWVGELSTLASASLAAQGALLLGALFGGTRGDSVGDLGLFAWLVACTALSLHLGALALLLLRTRAPGIIQALLWWVGLLIGPEVLGAGEIPIPLDIARHLRDVGAPQDLRHHLATVSLLAGLLGLAALSSSSRPVRGGNRTGLTP